MRSAALNAQLAGRAGRANVFPIPATGKILVEDSVDPFRLWVIADTVTEGFKQLRAKLAARLEAEAARD